MTDTQESGAYAAVAQRIAEARTDWESSRDLTYIRRRFEALFDTSELTAGTRRVIGGIATEAFGAASGRDPILYFHGGGYQIGSLVSHRGIMTELAERSFRPVIGADYRLAPEYRFPAAIEDGLSVYRALCEDPAVERISLAGDSAGGGLALAVLQRAEAEHLPAPASVVLISPWLDIGLRGPSYEDRAGRDIFSVPAALRLMARSYVGKDGDVNDPLVSPVHMQMDRLPSMMIHAGDADITLSDSLTFAERARSAGRSVGLRIWPGMFHHFQMFPVLPEAQESLAQLGAFLAK
ncbi:alpha/beta hydrolase [uncultured Roseibium sp.]|uniref:alpha/beta hydrolase n=1 Tax=uncultured Roseibium sp. TaxID=1936171 RepID=UPI0032172CC6